MLVSIVTDELSGDPETAFELGLEWGVDRFELRGLHGDRVPRVSPYARHRLVRAVRGFGVTITAVSPGLFKCPFPDAEPVHSSLGWMGEGHFRSWQEARDLARDHLERLLPETIAFAGEVAARFIIAFSFHRGGQPGGSAPAGVIEALTEAAERVSAPG